jgi:hypothetical protein
MYLGSSRASLIRHRGLALTLTLARDRPVPVGSISVLEPELALRRRFRRGCAVCVRRRPRRCRGAALSGVAADGGYVPRGIFLWCGQPQSRAPPRQRHGVSAEGRAITHAEPARNGASGMRLTCVARAPLRPRARNTGQADLGQSGWRPRRAARCDLRTCRARADARDGDRPEDGSHSAGQCRRPRQPAQAALAGDRSGRRNMPLGRGASVREVLVLAIHPVHRTRRSAQTDFHRFNQVASRGDMRASGRKPISGNQSASDRSAPAGIAVPAIVRSTADVPGDASIRGEWSIGGSLFPIPTSAWLTGHAPQKTSRAAARRAWPRPLTHDRRRLKGVALLQCVATHGEPHDPTARAPQQRR